MPRGKYKKQEIIPDSRYNDFQVAKFINQVMKKGQKETARNIVYRAFEEIEKKTKKDPVEVFKQAIANASPQVKVRSKRVGGATYQVPVPVRTDRKQAFAMQWILQAARAKKRKSMEEKLANEIIEAAENKGVAIKKKEDTHRMAEANRAFAHFKW